MSSMEHLFISQVYLDNRHYFISLVIFCDVWIGLWVYRFIFNNREILSLFFLSHLFRHMIIIRWYGNSFQGAFLFNNFFTDKFSQYVFNIFLWCFLSVKSGLKMLKNLNNVLFYMLSLSKTYQRSLF